MNNNTQCSPLNGPLPDFPGSPEDPSSGMGSEFDPQRAGCGRLLRQVQHARETGRDGRRVRDADDRLALEARQQVVQDFPFQGAIEGGGEFVQHENLGLAHQGASQGHALQLSAGHRHAVPAQHRVMSLRQPLGDPVQSHLSRCILDDVERDLVPSQGDVVADGEMEELHALADVSEEAVVEGRGKFVEGPAAQQDPTLRPTGISPAAPATCFSRYSTGARFAAPLDRVSCRRARAGGGSHVSVDFLLQDSAAQVADRELTGVEWSVPLDHRTVALRDLQT